MGNDTSIDENQPSYSNHTVGYSGGSTTLQPPHLHDDNTTIEYSHSISQSKSKSKSKSGKKDKNTWKHRSNSKTKSTISSNFQSAASNSSSSSHSYSPRNANMMQYQSQKIDVSKIQNGITNHYINARIVKIAAQFWDEHISHKSLPEQLVCIKYPMFQWFIN